jgi:hypothetical protein
MGTSVGMEITSGLMIGFVDAGGGGVKLVGVSDIGIVGDIGVICLTLAGILTRMAVFGLSQLFTFWETQRTNSIAEVLVLLGTATLRVLAVLIAFVSFSFRYQMLFVPPFALKIMLLSNKVAVGVPALTGADGTLNACADVPNEGKLSHPSFRQVALYILGLRSV